MIQTGIALHQMRATLLRIDVMACILGHRPAQSRPVESSTADQTREMNRAERCQAPGPDPSCSFPKRGPHYRHRTADRRISCPVEHHRVSSGTCCFLCSGVREEKLSTQAKVPPWLSKQPEAPTAKSFRAIDSRWCRQRRAPAERQSGASPRGCCSRHAARKRGRSSSRPRARQCPGSREAVLETVRASASACFDAASLVRNRA
jgi:hypothetical protein